MTIANRFSLFELPPSLNSYKPTDIEERCTAPLRIPFIQLKQLGVRKQLGKHSNTVNIPIDPVHMVNVLPRKFEQRVTVHLKFKKRLKYKGYVVHETVQPKVIYNVTKYFIDNSPLYKEEGVRLDSDWKGLKRKRVFLKRRVADVQVTAYNVGLLRIWQANTDLQFILDPWAVCVCISSYMMKTQREMSNLLTHACNEARTGNMSVREKLRRISDKFLNHCEIPTQEAGSLLLQMPLVQSSCDVVFINTSAPDQRVFIVKPKEQLQGLPHDTTEVTCSGLQEKYTSRPNILENLPIAEYAALFQEHANKNISFKENEAEQDKTDITVENIEPGVKIPLPIGSYLVKRAIPKAIRYVHFNGVKYPQLFYKELIMLFTLWRDEDRLKGKIGTFELQFQKLESETKAAMKRFGQCGNAIECAISEIN